ncbi:hypothetical protein MSAN_01888700 [Mycena sanguinolenta]|uniref:Uncharacterized protein n=1 Tax=Mycena sanguinolenta TaxID=230812 RepID=A0A8H6XRG1_9AGAR|nr:hypothetical protein MSAN_01888700 [Mycena sanguinolenta]
MSKGIKNEDTGLTDPGRPMTIRWNACGSNGRRSRRRVITLGLARCQIVGVVNVARNCTKSTPSDRWDRERENGRGDWERLESSGGCVCATTSVRPGVVVESAWLIQSKQGAKKLSPPLSRRTLRSGKEYSAFDLALGLCVDFDIQKCLEERIWEQEKSGVDHEREQDLVTPAFADLTIPPLVMDAAPTLGSAQSVNQATASSRPTSAPISVRTFSPYEHLSPDERNKLKSRARRDKGREAAQQASGNPFLKSVHQKRVNEAKTSYIEVKYDANKLPRTIPAWIGNRLAQDSELIFDADQTVRTTDDGMGGRMYTQAEVDKLVGDTGFRYIPWLGLLTIAILDSRRRAIGLLGGQPKDVVGWAKVIEHVSDALQRRIPDLELPESELHHRRAYDEEPFPAVSRGLSHGGGQTQPGRLQQNVTNTRITDEFLEDPIFNRMAGFGSKLLLQWAPKLGQLYVKLKKAFQARLPAFSLPARFNFGPRAATRPHLDFANLAWGWCSITALGSFDPDFGGHLILWDLRLVIRFPPGSTILIPSAIIRHSNAPVRPHETRSSFTQYTAGGLFRWVRNGFMRDEDFQKRASASEKAKLATEAATRWEDGMNMFSCIDDF